MADLGTLWFDTRLKDTATKDAERIRKELSHKLSDVPINIKLDHSNIDGIRRRIQEALSRSDFKIKVNIDSSSLSGIQRLGGLTEAQARAAKATAEAALAEAKLATERQRTLAATANAQKAEILLDQARQRAFTTMSEQQKSMVALRASLNGGISAVSSMTDAMVGLFTINAGKQFLSNIIEIGGQLEKQRISMGAILGDTARANTLFSQIKGLALKSPFGVVELDQYSKQLAAYGVEQSQLYDMTRRLADISAGAGQDIGRLALALGHVKSATYLTGITLRQFSMNNIPMLKMLAEYYSEVEKRAVSTAEVQKRISQRQVSYEDVEAQIKRMTDEGGMFYNMQEKISESVAAKWKNLRDSMDIMYGEMAESGLGQVLKDTATALMGLTTHWQEMITLIGVGAAVWGTWRASLAANNVLLGRNTVATLQNINANRQAQTLMMRYAFTYRKLTAEEMAYAIGAKNISRLQALGVTQMTRLSAARRSLILTTRKQSIEEMRMALNSKKIVAEDLAKAVALGQVSKARARLVIMTSSLTEAEQKNAIAAVNAVRTYKMGSAAVNAFALGIGKLAVAIKSLLFSPQLWIFALIAGITELWMKNKLETDRAIELNDELFNRAQEGLKNIRNMMAETNMTFKVDGKNNIDNFGKVPGTLGFPSADSITSDDMRKSMEIWEQFIKEYAATPNIMLNAAYATDNTGKSVHSLAEQYEILGRNVMIVAESYKYLPNVADALTDAIQESDGGWFDDDLITDIKDYNDALKEQQRTITLYYKQYQKASIKALDAARSDAAFAKAVKDSGIAIEDVNGQMVLLAENQDKYSNAVDKFKEAFQSVSNIGMEWLFDNSKVSDASEEMESEFEQVAQRMKDSLESKYGEFEKLGEAQKEALGQAITQALSDMVTKAGISVDQVKDKVMELGRQNFGIQIDAKTAEAAAHISALKEQLNKLVGGDWIIDIGTSTNAFDVIQKIREAYKSAKDQIENAEPILIKYGLTAGGVGVMTDEQIEQYAGGDEFVRSVLRGVRESQKKIDQAMKSSDKYGFSLTDPTRGGKVFRDKKSKSGGSNADKELKEAQTRFDEIKSFLDEYKKYSKTYSQEESINILENLFPTMKGKGKEAVDNFKQVLENIKGSLKMSTEERKKFGISIDKYIADFNQSEAQKIIDDQLKEVKEYISKQSEKYNLYKSLFEKTGDSDIAKMAFGNGRIFDDLAKELQSRLQEKTGNAVINYDMSDADAEKAFKDLPGAYELWKKIAEITSKNYADALTKSADAQAKIMSNQEQIAVLYDKIAKAEADTSGINHTAEIQQWTDEITRLKSELFEMLPIYEKIFGERQYESFSSLKEAERIVKELVANATAQGVDKKTGRASYFSSFYMDGNDQQQVTMTRQQLERLKKAIDGFFSDELKANPFRTLVDSIKNMWRGLTKHDVDVDTKDWRKFGESISEVADIIGGFAGKASDMFDSLGNEGMADAMSDVEAGMQSVSNIGKGFAQGGLVGGIAAAAGEAVGWIGKMAQSHDKKLDKAIKKSQQEVKKLQNAYKNLEWEISHQLTSISKDQSTRMLEDLKRTQAELERQIQLERDKKKTDYDKIIDMEQSVEEAKQQIKTFYEDLAKERYSADLDSWANDIASALVDAFAAGEDAAVAFDNTVAKIMKDVVNNIVKISVVKPAMEGLKDFLFGTNGIATTNSSGGVEITANEAADLVGQLVKLKSQIDNGANIYNIVAEAMKSLGLDMNGNSGSSMSNSIKGMSEQQADILASYINAIRADVAIDREMLMTTMPMLASGVQQCSVLAQQQVAHQEQIASNTLRNAEAASQIYDLLHRVELGGSYLNVR